MAIHRLLGVVALALSQRLRFYALNNSWGAAMRKFWAPTLGVFFATAAYCQVPAPAPPKAAPEPSAYCRSAAQILFQGGGDAEIANVSRSCKRGDIIAINSSAQGSVFQVGRLCDFTKSVVVMGPQTLCALAAERGLR